MKRRSGVGVPKIKLDLSYGTLPADSTFIRPKGFDPLVYPWSLKAESVEEAFSGFLLQRIPGPERGRFMDQLWRVLVPSGKATFIVPYWTNARAIQDPCAAWPPLAEQSFLYFNKKFRLDNHVEDGMTCDFDFVYGYNWDPETAGRPDDTRPFWAKHYTNAIADLQLVLTKRT